MISLFVTLVHIWRGLRGEFKNPEFRALLFVVTGLLVTGTVFYTQVEGWRWLDSLYFCVITLTTIGYGDFSPQTDFGKVFTILYIVVGVGTLLSFITVVGQHTQKYNPMKEIWEGVDDLMRDEKKKPYKN